MSKEAVLNIDIKATNGGVEEKGRERKMRKENDKMDTDNEDHILGAHQRSRYHHLE
jgi:hypothetical protein